MIKITNYKTPVNDIHRSRSVLARYYIVTMLSYGVFSLHKSMIDESSATLARLIEFQEVEPSISRANNLNPHWQSLLKNFFCFHKIFNKWELEIRFDGFLVKANRESWSLVVKQKSKSRVKWSLKLKVLRWALELRTKRRPWKHWVKFNKLNSRLKATPVKVKWNLIKWSYAS